MSEEPQAQVDKWVQQYIILRDWLRAEKKSYEGKIEEAQSAMERFAGRLQQFLDNSGVESAKTNEGTVYSYVRYTASLADPDLFMKFVVDNKQFDLLDRRANVSAVRDYVKHHNQLPAGCSLSALKTVGVRRPANGEK